MLPKANPGAGTTDTTATQTRLWSKCRFSRSVIVGDKFVGVSMSREFDPNNLTFGDVLRAIVPLVAVIAIISLVGQYAPDYVLLVVVAIVGFIFYWIFTLPKKDVEAIAEADRKLENRIQNIPIIGPVAGAVFRIFNWLGLILGAVTVVWLVYSAIKNVL